MIFIILALVCYSIAILFAASASRNTHPTLAAAITNAISVVVPVVAAIPLVTKKTLGNQRFGLAMAALSGLAISLFVIFVNKSYAVNKVGVVTPIVFGGSIFLTSILSYFIFKEKVGTIQFVGLAFLGVGLALIIYARVTGR